MQDWRQVRVPLEPYAGRENLRLRIDFATGGNLNLGDVNTTGFEIRAVPGVDIRDGDTVQVGTRTLEFESGLTLVAPTGAAIPPAPALPTDPPGEQITITDRAGNTATLQYVNNVLTSSNIVATDGSQLLDGETFQINDGTTTKTFEFDSGYILEVPATGGAGLTEAGTFTVDVDGAGLNLPLTFEFDKDGVFNDADANGVPDNTLINIADNLTLVVPAGGGGAIGDQERYSVRRVTPTGTTTYTFEFDKTGVLTTPFNLAVNVLDNFTINLPVSGGGFGGVQDGQTFVLDPDGTGIKPPVVFEFVEEGTARIPVGNELIPFNHFTTQDVLADRVAAAVTNQFAALGLTGKNTGGGVVVLDGRTTRHTLTVNAPVTQGVVPLTQLEVAERMIAAMDKADGVDGTILGSDPAERRVGRSRQRQHRAGRHHAPAPAGHQRDVRRDADHDAAVGGGSGRSHGHRHPPGDPGPLYRLAAPRRRPGRRPGARAGHQRRRGPYASTSPVPRRAWR